MFKRRVYKCHNLSDPRGYFRMVRPLIKELITEEMLEMIQLTQGLISSVIQKSWKDSTVHPLFFPLRYDNEKMNDMQKLLGNYAF